MEQLLSNEDKIQISSILQVLDENTDYFQNICDNVVNAYLANLDDLTIKIRQTVFSEDGEYIPTDVIEDYTLKLSSELCFISRKLGAVGIKEDIMKATRQEVYNKHYLNNDREYINSEGKKIKPTKDANVAYAEEQSKYQTVLHNLYSRIYKVLQCQVDATFELLNSLKKVLSRRMQIESDGRYPNKLGGQ